MIRERGKNQPKSKTVVCTGCSALLEYLDEDVREEDGFFYVDCPRRGCKNANYLGTVTQKGQKNVK